MSAIDYTPFMREALNKASNARYMTYPNPSVGALLLRDCAIVASGWHTKAGAAHAEIECLRDAQKKGIDPKGCTLIVTLEPCRHFGKTPPCTEAIIKAGITRVVFGLRDPTEQAGGGAEVLRSAGIEVLGPICEEACRDMLADFLVWTKEKRPYTLLKMAETLDGRIATRTGHSQWISSEESRQVVHRLRATIAQRGGVVLVGGRTFTQDNPRLTARIDGAIKNPRACVLTSTLPDPGAPYALLRDRPNETIFFTTKEEASSKKADSLRAMGVCVFSLPYTDGLCDLKALFATLFCECHAPYVLCEGGGFLGLRLLTSRLVDEFHLHLAPILLADNNALPLFSGLSPLTIAHALRLRCTQCQTVGEDVHLLLRPKLCE
ncbi:MAG: bifunctional diaminohydroxyphosphoribosylaminopyrimidine deaminase/5-amino-6-(5-phosphoribosylamino)uracil reductase RibD [Desulfovibrionaceae bacterium]|nr:bifunctional diaminohydroxyphosphoribosylaminopyrimidine deaminase/5-amino-6-(5-phosphoribosylamino)uracil reductase RibD [Desulfovibrionaceae bacterium]